MNKRIPLIFLFFISFFPTHLWAQREVISNEQIYRELKIFETKTEERFKTIDERFKSIDERFKSIDEKFVFINQRFSDMFTFLWIITGIFTAIMLSTISLLFWDRKTIVETSVKKSIEKIESEGLPKKLLDAFRELAKEDQKVATVLKNFNLL